LTGGGGTRRCVGSLQEAIGAGEEESVVTFKDGVMTGFTSGSAAEIEDIGSTNGEFS